MKVNSTIYKGIEYVQVSSLPADQKEKLLQTINHDLLIKMLVDEKLIGIVATRDLLFENDMTKPVTAIMSRDVHSASPNCHSSARTSASARACRIARLPPGSNVSASAAPITQGSATPSSVTFSSGAETVGFGGWPSATIAARATSISERATARSVRSTQEASVS